MRWAVLPSKPASAKWIRWSIARAYPGQVHIEDYNHGNQKREHAGRQKALSPRKEKVKHASYEHEEAEEAGFVGVSGHPLRHG